MSAIRRYAREIVEYFRPEKIILFGSYAYGTPSPDSDVDLLVVMPTRNELEQAVRIDERIRRRGFPLDLLVRTPTCLQERLRHGDYFVKEVLTKGRVLYERDYKAVGAEGRKQHRCRSALAQAAASRHG